ncbi:family 43 glycosylhydrolase [Pedobacter steynii]|uniref:Arabinan endo-1,5-alpha-L-arabinosidase n=1 Tax=Pedobacter steynii TaxID=430522 RepID=A0A1D7QLB1_9SPHI|nr:family 43 glycosylhydrolase [Pedobacter steynii]AOM79399.1 arabinan endo-1,5-alpha-L-arabinosidase [Pedobacter steynii]
MMRKNIFLYLAIPFLFAGCGKSGTSVKEGGEEPTLPTKNLEFINPVFEPILADPSIVKGEDGWFYGYGTEDNWGDGQGNRLVPVVRSLDLIKWTVIGNAFTAKPQWKSDGGIWAPDVVLINKKYYMYYSYSAWADPNPGIGLAVASNPGGPFIDQGKLFLSSEIGVPNTIDPFYFSENNKKYLFFGSYSSSVNQGTYVVELAEDGFSVKNLNDKVKIAAGDFEAVMIHKRKGYYYFFGSKGSCCSGSSSTYHVRVARSAALLGPYLDKDGKSIAERGSGTLLISGSDKYAGPGHNSRIISDRTGTDWLLYHAINKTNPIVPGGASRRMLMLDKINWVDDWPVIENSIPGNALKKGPEF